jgi:hypothetical protein
MEYEIAAIIATVTTCGFSAAYALACHRKYQAFCAWPHWDRGRGISIAYEEFLRLRRIETYIWFGLLISFSITYILTSLLGDYQLVRIEHAWIIADCAVFSLMSFAAAMVMAALRQCVLK